jgi:hypothetical protein
MTLTIESLREASVYLELVAFTKVMQTSVAAKEQLKHLRSCEDFVPHVYELIRSLVLSVNNEKSYLPMLTNPHVYLTVGEPDGWREELEDAFPGARWTDIPIPGDSLWEAMHIMQRDLMPPDSPEEQPLKIWLRHWWARQASLPYHACGCALKAQRTLAAKFALAHITHVRHLRSENARINLMVLEFQWGPVRFRLTAIDRFWFDSATHDTHGSEEEANTFEEDGASEAAPNSSGESSFTIEGDVSDEQET